MPLKTFVYKHDLFITARTTCVGCGHRFKYSLTFAQLLTWDSLCMTCAPNIIDLPKQGKMDFAVLDINQWV